MVIKGLENKEDQTQNYDTGRTSNSPTTFFLSRPL